MTNYRIVVLPGDGIGDEITHVTVDLLRAISSKHKFKLDISYEDFGGSAIDKYNDPLPIQTLNACKASDAVLLAAIGSPKYDNNPRDQRPESGLLRLRSEMELFANLRPVKTRHALLEASSLKPEYIKDVDLLVVRELTGGIYFGKPKAKVNTDNISRAFNTMVYSDYEINRIAQIAFELSKNRRKLLCSVDKANVLEVSQLWRECVTSVSKEYPDITLSHQYVDNAAMQLIRKPDQFDVILTSNLFGDILSDEAAMLTGSIGMLPSASINLDGPGLFEPVHGSAPDIAGQDIANPIAMILSASMLLRIGLQEIKAADDLEKAVDMVLTDGYRTPDLLSINTKKVGCKEMGNKILQSLNEI